MIAATQLHGLLLLLVAIIGVVSLGAAAYLAYTRQLVPAFACLIVALVALYLAF